MDNADGGFRVLTLDGGDTKGFYTLGVLHELEAMVGCRLCERFDLIYGTSTGSIIGTLLALSFGAKLRVVEATSKAVLNPEQMAEWKKLVKRMQEASAD